MPRKTKKAPKPTKVEKKTKVVKTVKSPKTSRLTKSSKKVVVKKVAKQTRKVVVPSLGSKIKQWLATHSQLLAVLGILIGVQLMLASGWYILYRKTILSFQVAPIVAAESHQETPISIDIEDHSINLPIIPATINEGIWPVDDHNALHLATSAYPGERGNIVIYGHNTAPVFGNLKKVAVGDTIKVTTDTDVVHTYVVKEVLTVKPSDIEVVLPTDHEVLTVYTCIGWLDSQRLVLKAYPEATVF
jgi:LPXTG-site transpeptidase (sortase) family protein